MPENDAASDAMELMASRLREWRHSHDLPLKRVAHDMDVSISTVSAWEKGDRFPSMECLKKISEYTEIPLCAFFHTCSTSGCPHFNGKSSPPTS